jgi:hypothetical protein
MLDVISGYLRPVADAVDEGRGRRR